MSTENTTPGDASSEPEPGPDCYHRQLPDYPEVRVTVLAAFVDGYCSIEYRGWPEDLAAAGVMLAPWAIPGARPRDPDGGRVSISRWWRSIDGQSRRYCAVSRYRPSGDLFRWPGAIEALKAYEKYVVWRHDKIAARNAESSAVASELSEVMAAGQASRAREKPMLRLVVNNA